MVDVAPGEARLALIVFDALPHVVRLSWRYCSVSRSRTSSWTRWTPLVAVAVPSTVNGTSDGSTRPSIGLVIAVSLGSVAGMLLKS